MLRPLIFLLSILAPLLFSPSAFADEQKKDAPVYVNDYKPAANTSAEEPKKDGPVYVGDYKPEAGTTLPADSPFLSLRLNYGTFHTNGNAGLKNPSHGSAGGFEIGILPAEILSFCLDFMYATRSYDTTVSSPPLGNVSTRMDLDTTALLLGARVAYPPRKSYRAHATAGIGYFRSQLWASASLFGIPGDVSEEDSSFGFHAGAGFEAEAGNLVFGVDYRRWFVNASFPTFGINSADIGGDYFGVSIGWLFR